MTSAPSPPKKKRTSYLLEGFSWKLHTFEDFEDLWCVFFSSGLCVAANKTHWVDHVNVFQSFQQLVVKEETFRRQNKSEHLESGDFLARSVQQLHYYI